MSEGRRALKILVLTFYFRPDLSAGAFRTTAVVRALEESTGPSDSIDVITTAPNRYASFAQEAPEEEIHGRVRIRRIQVPAHRSGMADQAWAFARFALQVRRLVAGKRFDAVYATSSRLFTAFLGALCAKRTDAALYLDIRDIFTDTIEGMLSKPLAFVLMPALNAIERFTVTSAAHVNLVSEGFRKYFQKRYTNQRYSFHTNGIDDEFLHEGFSLTASARPTRRVLYAGNIGEGQGLHRIVPGLAKAAGPAYEFRLVGDGGRIQMLREALEEAGVGNVRIWPPVDRARLMQLYRDSDYLFLHLNDYAAFRKVLPSKIFEYAATGKPILAGVAGHCAQFLRENVKNCAVFPPCEVAAGLSALESLSPEPCDRTEFVTAFQRSRIMKRLADEVVKLGLSRENRLSPKE